MNPKKLDHEKFNHIYSCNNNTDSSLNQLKSAAIHPDQCLKKRKNKKKNNWYIGHYIPISTILISNKTHSLSQQSHHYRWSSKLSYFEKKQSMPSITKSNDSNTIKYQALKVICKIFSKNVTISSSKNNLRISQTRHKSKNNSQDPVDTPKPNISYPMKLHNTDISFVTTQDPWDSLIQSSNLSRRTTLATKYSQDRSSSSKERRLSSSQPSTKRNRLSLSVNHRNSYVTPTSNRISETEPITSDKSENQFKSSFDSKCGEIYSFPPTRGGLYRHPPTRPLSLSNHSRRNSALVLNDQVSHRMTIDGGSRRSSMISSNKTFTTNPMRQSWNTGLVALENSTSHGSALTCSESSLVSISATDPKRISSLCLPAINNWAGVIEEDITVTLMGCPETKNNFTNSFAIDIPAPAASVSRAQSLISSNKLVSHKSFPAPSQSTSSPHLSPSDLSKHPTSRSLRSTSLGHFHRPLSFMFHPLSSPLLEESDLPEQSNSVWFAEIMSSVEHTISKIS